MLKLAYHNHMTSHYSIIKYGIPNIRVSTRRTVIMIV